MYTFPIKSHKATVKGVRSVYHSGISIEMTGDFTDHNEGRVTANLVPDHPNCVMIQLPLLPRSIVGKNSKKQHALNTLECIRDNRDASLTHYAQLPDDKKIRKLLVICADDVVLLNQPFWSDEFEADILAGRKDAKYDIDYEVKKTRHKTTWTKQAAKMDPSTKSVVMDKDGKVVMEEVDIYTYQSHIKWAFVDKNTLTALDPPKLNKPQAGDKLGDLDDFDKLNLDDDDDEDS